MFCKKRGCLSNFGDLATWHLFTGGQAVFNVIVQEGYPAHCIIPLEIWTGRPHVVLHILEKNQRNQRKHCSDH